MPLIDFNSENKPKSRKRQSKFTNKPFWYDVVNDVRYSELGKHTGLNDKDHKRMVYFASELEFKIYCVLCSRFTSEAIDTQVTIPLIPKTPRNKAITWRIDFKVKGMFVPGYKDIYVEAKGKELSDFQLKYELFKHFNKDALIVVAHNAQELIDYLHTNDLINVIEHDRFSRIA